MRHVLQDRSSPFLSAWAVVVALVAALEICVVIAASRHGFDFTDEGFYLNSIARDSEGVSHVSFFGQVYRPVASALEGDVGALRWFNISVIVLAGGVLGWALVTRGSFGREGARWTTYSAIGATAASTLGFFGTGLLTPSYNSLAATGLLLVASGLVLACEAPSPRPRTAATVVLIGLGGVTAFLGKPGAAMATAVVVGIALLASGPQGRRAVIPSLAIAASALLAVSWAQTGSLLGLVHRMRQSVEDAHALEAGHDLASAVIAFGLPQTSDRAVVVSLVLSAAAFAWARIWLTSGKRRWAWILVAGILAAVVAYWLSDRVGTVSYFVPTRALVIAAAPLGLIAAALLMGHRRPDRATWTLAIALCLLPHAWIFGSNNDYWHGASLLYVLWFAGGVVLLGTHLDRHSTAPVVAALPMVLLTAAVIAAVLAAPYRQVVPLFDQQTLTRVGPSGTLLLAPDFARVIEHFRHEARKAGFTPGTTVIDLTGQMPGLIYALEGEAAGAPWIIGGYPGSDAVAVRTLARTPCATLARSWLMQEPGGTRAIDPAALSAGGATLADWQPVTSGSITTAPATRRLITLLAPSGSYADRRAACEAAR
jgi:hypothetical protein